MRSSAHASSFSLVGNVCSSFTFHAVFVHICPMSNAHSSCVGIIAISSLLYLYCLCFCVVPYASWMHPSLLHCLRVSIFHMPLAHTSSVGIGCASFTAVIALCSCRPVPVLNVYCALLYVPA
eukprot:scaffold11574_cov132-Skeletonema_dohrnii-CCMP3373.AAC.1